MECINKAKNLKDCNCSYSGCDKKGMCCECMRYHRAKRQLPACFFPDDVEKSFDRSFERFKEVS